MTKVRQNETGQFADAGAVTVGAECRAKRMGATVLLQSKTVVFW